MSTVMDVILHCQRKLQKDQDSERTLHYLGRLGRLQVTVQHLQQTGIGKTVNALRKDDGIVGETARAIVTKWKAMVSAEEDSETYTEQGDVSRQADVSPPTVPVEPQVKEKVSHTSHSKRSNSEVSAKEEPLPKKHKKHESRETRHESSKRHKSRDERESNNRHKVKEGNGETNERHKSKHTSNRSNERGNEEPHRKTREVRDSKNGNESKERSKVKLRDVQDLDRNRKRKVKVAKYAQLDDSGEIDCTSGASFADALGFSETSSKKAAKSSSTKNKIPPSLTKFPTNSKSKIPPPSILQNVETKNSSYRSSSLPVPSASPSPSPPLSPSVSSLNIGTSNLLPAISPNYRPLPYLENGDRNKSSVTTDEEALSLAMSNKNRRTKVYSGKHQGRSHVPSLQELCIRILQEHIDDIAYTGGIPYIILRPILERATAVQLFRLEHDNPYLMDDTDTLWRLHCKRDFRNEVRQEMETWREVYLRCYDAREEKFKRLKNNIQASMAKAAPVRQTKPAFLDVAKPPRTVARKQAKYGTAKASTKAAVKITISQPEPSESRATSVTGRSSSAGVSGWPTGGGGGGSSAGTGGSTNSSSSAAPKKPKVAPLMQKTLKFIKNRFKR